jgi:RNA polymerase sigma-70 factor (ECF subfamily)
MSGSSQISSAPAMPRLPESFVVQLYGAVGAEKLGLTLEEFAGVLQEVGAKYLPAGAGPEEAEVLIASLRVNELALARACAKGSEPAWDIFLTRYRNKLYDAAHSIAREESAARDLADSLYADLFGTTARDGRRVSKLNSYTGRGSLEGWLRSVLAQEYVNRYRSQRRLISLEEQAEAGVQFQAQEADQQLPYDSRLEAAADEALQALSAEERLILASYYLDGRTLAEVASLLGVHESTISRRVEKITASVRKRIIKGLLQRGMSRSQAEEALQADVRDLSLDVRQRLMQEKRGQIVP